jgi:N-acetylmuramoyl-L-alanine amidase
MRSFLAASILIALLSGCASGPLIDTTYQSRSQGSRVTFLILHYTALDFAKSLRTLTEDEVSSHYLVNDDPPVVYRLVDEWRRANHAGVSAWAGLNQLNATSIGIEIVNPGYRDTAEGRVWASYRGAQIDAVVALVKDIVARHDIRPDRILGHSDIAPQRKQDPGPRFPWKRLADEGLIPWPDPARVSAREAVYRDRLPDVAWFQQKLAQHGFTVPRTGQLDRETSNVIAAFQMKYRQDRFDGLPDAETAALLDVLVAMAAGR